MIFVYTHYTVASANLNPNCNHNPKFENWHQPVLLTLTDLPLSILYTLAMNSPYIVDRWMMVVERRKMFYTMKKMGGEIVQGNCPDVICPG